jgi:tRNA(Arg) A34 adenosine deaminase TadA
MSSTTSSISPNTIATMAVATVAVVAHAIALSVVYSRIEKLENNNYNYTATKTSKNKVVQHRTAPLCNHCDDNHNQTTNDDDDGNNHQAVVITLPKWTNEFINDRKGKVYTTDEEMMQVAMDLADRNITEGTGGPFGTAIFEYDILTGETTLFSIGINQVVALGNSTLHGEMTAIQFGEKKLGTFSFPRAKSKTKDVLGSTKEYHLYTSCAPCAQCLGGTLWSGVSKLVCGAGKEDAEAIGFDEGPVYAKSYEALEASGCNVKHGVLREQGAAILRRYAETGVIYNAD